MKKETLLHSKKIQKMITQYKHDMQLVDQLTADAAPHYEIEQDFRFPESNIHFDARKDSCRADDY